jgi:hypothetical protein
MKSIGFVDVVLIGLFQAFALMPGVSRSGITMTAGLMRGFNRMSAARFSFLLSVPVIFGAGVYNLPDIIRQGSKPGQLGFYLAGFFAAAVSGYLVIAFLLRFIQSHSFAVFAYYRFVLAGVVLLIYKFYDRRIRNTWYSARCNTEQHINFTRPYRGLFFCETNFMPIMVCSITGRMMRRNYIFDQTEMNTAGTGE